MNLPRQRACCASGACAAAITDERVTGSALLLFVFLTRKQPFRRFGKKFLGFPRVLQLYSAGAGLCAASPALPTPHTGGATGGLWRVVCMSVTWVYAWKRVQRGQTITSRRTHPSRFYAVDAWCSCARNLRLQLNDRTHWQRLRPLCFLLGDTATPLHKHNSQRHT